MFFDLHAHSSGISPCCRMTAGEVIATARDAGYDGIVLTNHYQKSYLRGASPEDFAKRYLAEYEEARKIGQTLGVQVWFGIEVTMEAHGGVHMLLYGVDAAFLTATPTLYEMTQEELYSAVHGVGGVLVQAHPMRGGRNVLLDPVYLDGVEANCHKVYPDGVHYEALSAFAAENGLMMTCGCDYHADAPRPHGGTVLPDDLSDSAALARYLYATDHITLRLEEPNETEAREVLFRRGIG